MEILHTVHGILQARMLAWVAFPSPGDRPNPGIEPRSPTLQADSLPAEPQGKPRSYGNSLFNFLMLDFSEVAALFYFQQSVRIPVSLRPCWHLLLLVLLIISILLGVKWVSWRFWIISLMTTTVEHLFVCLLAHCINISSLEKYLFRSFAHF